MSAVASASEEQPLQMYGTTKLTDTVSEMGFNHSLRSSNKAVGSVDAHSILYRVNNGLQV